ncbi:hypothetical protein Cgig2_019498 [Carnegiea gigantea]|uniref:MADS-box domain-containing protein n=1 Tax=Carnegiea gigantea TaxID=171969 RepID=A0A9Q1KRB2_9CARY|nr:hypothetical protein Cgig2_019498 [Carnegiea gigantea]
MAKPTSKGRRKLEMKKIETKTSLGVTFAKRRNGIFKKANELVTLCGAALAVIIFSPSKKAYSFGHPNQASQQGYPMDIMGSEEQLSLSQAMQLQAMLKDLKMRVSCEVERRSILESMENGDNLNNNSVNDGDQLGVMFNCFDSPGTSNIPGPNYGPSNP